MTDAIPRHITTGSGSGFPAASVHETSKGCPRRSRKGEKRTPPMLLPIDPESCMGAIDSRRGDRRRWHIIGEDGGALCDRVPEDTELVMRSLGELALEPLICRPCHVRYSWTAMPQDVEYQDRGYPTPCRVWKRGLNGKGYGERIIPGVKVPTHAHREAYEAAYGPIPAGFVIHHHCEQRDCLEPTHLEAMSRADHIRLHMGEAKRLGRFEDTA